MRKSTHGFLASALLLGLTCSATDSVFGCRSETLYSAYASDGARVKSPDGKNLVSVTTLYDNRDPEGYISYRVRAGQQHFSTRLSGFRTEVLWSPDSKAFAVNQTEGGGGIGQRAYIFYLTDDGLRKIDVSAPVEKAFGAPVKCDVPVLPNTAALKWLDSNRILVVAEVVPVSICKCRGTFQTYEVSLPDLGILHVHSQVETKRSFADALGCELRGGDDRCARSWQTPRPRHASLTYPARNLH
jgi:hypothetical protein